MADAKTMVDDLLKAAKDNLEAARKEECEDRLNIYHDNWTDILKEEIDAQFSEDTRENVKQMLALDSNVLKRIIKEISIVYQKSATRSYTTGEGDTAKEDENYSNLLKQIPVNLTLQETNRLTNLCNESLIQVVPRNERIEYDILTPDLVEVYQNKNNAKEIDAIVYTQTFVDTRGDTTIYYIYWDIYGNHWKFDVEGEPQPIKDNKNNKNPYKDPKNPGKTILPFVLFHKDFPVNSIWNVTGGNDLVSGTKQIGVLLTYFNYILKTSTFKQLYFTGIDIKDVKQKLIYDQLFPLVNRNIEGKIGTIDYQVEIEKIWDSIIKKLGALANNYGMSLDNFKLTAAAESGYALKIKNRGLEKVVEEQIKLYRWHEKELFEKTKIVNNTMYSKNKIAEDGIFKIDFVEQQYPESPEEVRLQWDFDIQHGAKSIVDYAKFVNPDLKTDDEAKEDIKKNTDLNKEVAADTGVDIGKLIEKAFAPAEPATEGPAVE